MAALRRRGPVTVHRLDLAARRPLPKGLVPKLGRVLAPSTFLRAVHGLDPARLVRPDLIVSAGGMTLGANVALARHWGLPNVFSGSTRGYSVAAFRLVLTPYASRAYPPVVMAGPKPTPFDPDRVPPPQALHAAGDLRGKRISLLVGGPTPNADFGPDDWQRLAGLLDTLARDWDARITVVTSPRTPEAAYAVLMPLATRPEGAVTLVDFRQAGPGSIDAAFDCDLVLITSDSMSMMTEASLSRRPAIALSPNATRAHRDDEAVAGLVSARWLAVLALAETEAARLAETAAALTPMAENHLDRLAALVTRAIAAS